MISSTFRIERSKKDTAVSLILVVFLFRNILTEVPESRVHSIVDELTFKVISTFSPLVAR